MIYHISAYLQTFFSGFNVIHYVSVRAVIALLSTLFFSIVFGNWFIGQSHRFFKSKTREFLPERHKEKDDMPTMGGLFILLMVFANCLLWTNLSKPYVWVVLLGILLSGMIGCWDDWCKIAYKKGINASTKFRLQLLAATVTVLLLVLSGALSTVVVFPFLKTWQFDIGLFFIPWAVFIIVACSNAVNLTDGLDGLAIGSLIPNFATFSLIAYLAGHSKIASYLAIPFADSAEITVIGASLVGASLGFLWYNAYPAQIFMGDVGSLALGTALALMALMAKQEMVLAIAGGLFVLETVSVIIQVFSYKRFGKRLFRMAPIHHHFELLGWPEAKITTRFGIISLVLCLLALITLKLR